MHAQDVDLRTCGRFGVVGMMTVFSHILRIDVLVIASQLADGSPATSGWFRQSPGAFRFFLNRATFRSIVLGPFLQ